MHIRFIRVLAFCFLSALVPGAAQAQSAWLGTDRRAGVALEVLRPEAEAPFFFGGAEASLFSVAAFLSGRYPVMEELYVVAEVPFSRFGAEGGDAETTFGNLYLGVEFGEREDAFHGELGVRLPTSGENQGLITGHLSDPDRREAFSDDLLAASSTANYVYREPSGFSVQVRGGPTLWIGDDMELLADYGVHAWYAASEQVRIGVGLTGRVVITEGGLSLGERMVNQVGLAVIGRFEHVHPGLHARLPFDFDEDDFGEANYVLGLSLAVPLGP